MFNLLNSVTLDDLVDIAGVAGFILSFCLAVCGLWSNRISILLQDCELISLKEKPDFCFFLVCLCNKTKVPFSLVDIQIDDGTKHEMMGRNMIWSQFGEQSLPTVLWAVKKNYRQDPLYFRESFR